MELTCPTCQRELMVRVRTPKPHEPLRYVCGGCRTINAFECPRIGLSDDACPPKGKE